MGVDVSSPEIASAAQLFCVPAAQGFLVRLGCGMPGGLPWPLYAGSTPALTTSPAAAGRVSLAA